MESWELLNKMSSLLDLLHINVVKHQVHVVGTKEILGVQRCPSELRGDELLL